MGAIRTITWLAQSILSPLHESIRHNDRWKIRNQADKIEDVLQKHGLDKVRVMADYDHERAMLMLHLEGEFQKSQQPQFDKALEALREFRDSDNYTLYSPCCRSTQNSDIIKVGEAPNAKEWL